VAITRRDFKPHRLGRRTKMLVVVPGSRPRHPRGLSSVFAEGAISVDRNPLEASLRFLPHTAESRAD
jgi:hypothetical protein